MSVSDDELMGRAFVVGLFLGLLIAMWSCIWGFDQGVHQTQMKAVTAGVAHWVPDVSGESTFVFNTVTNK